MLLINIWFTIWLLYLVYQNRNFYIELINNYCKRHGYSNLINFILGRKSPYLNWRDIK